jgi:transcription elongation factor GreA
LLDDEEDEMAERIPVTRDGLDALRREHEELINERRPTLIQSVAAAREEGDLRENAGYHAARHDLGMIEGRIRELEQMLKQVEVIEESTTKSASGTVKLGSTVTIEIDGDKETYTIVGAVEARPTEGRISNESPFGKALLGARLGQTVTIQTPASMMKAKVVAVE